MLRKFEVENFKNFKNKITLNLADVKGYEFSKELIKNNTIRSGVLFGKNGSGKTNLTLAIFDIVNHLTDKTNTYPFINPFKNLNSTKTTADFSYTFAFEQSELIYMYKKSDPELLSYEQLWIDDELLIQFDHATGDGFCNLPGTENLNLKLEGNKLSVIKYIYNNTVLEDSGYCHIFKLFMAFVDNMLSFSSLQNNNQYFGYKTGAERISNAIIQKGRLKDFESFLNGLDIPCRLVAHRVNDEYVILNEFDHGLANFYETASTGTKSLALFYYWLINAADASFILLDEFDAYYHYELSEYIVKTILAQTECQVFFTSHNTNLMDSDLFRPDCLFIMQNSGVKPVSALTNKELRKAHNLQKMYKAGAFDETKG